MRMVGAREVVDGLAQGRGVEERKLLEGGRTFLPQLRVDLGLKIQRIVKEAVRFAMRLRDVQRVLHLSLQGSLLIRGVGVGLGICL